MLLNNSDGDDACDNPFNHAFSLGQIRFCYMCGGARGARGLVFTRGLFSIRNTSKNKI